MDKILGNIYQTKDYKKFKILGGNRRIDHSHKVAESIKHYGQLLSPIIVNEKFEIIDGQNRFEAFKSLDLPVAYTIAEGYGINECMAMNTVAKNWSTSDYIQSYADMENPDYICLAGLLKDYSKQLPTATILAVAFGNMDNFTSAVIRSGAFKVGFGGNEPYIREILDYLCKFDLSNIKGKASLLYKVFYFCFISPEIDNDKLLLFFEKYNYVMQPISDTKSAVENVEKVYNWKCNRSNYKFITAMYQKTAIERSATGTPGGGTSNFYD